ncbi:MAG TPA: DNRLRE domain-containing protein [Bacteroidia bacterium]|nr:DNRLRE domain-containing protein [Bacteroidia bacterium]
MKKTYIFVLMICIQSLNIVSAQTTLHLSLNANGEDAAIDNYNPGNNYPNEIEYNMAGWSISGTPVIWRNLFKFDLSQIPAGAQVLDAKLSLHYAVTNSYTNAPQQSLTHSNASIVQRVTSHWTESTATWNNQPTVTNLDALTLPQSTSANQDYLNMDVTAMVSQMVQNGNNGFLISMLDESPYARMIFASGDHPDTLLHPTLDVTYTDCITLVLSPNSEDVAIDNYNPSNNYGNEIEYNMAGWTINGTPVIWRNLFKFDLSAIPGTAVVSSASLSLFYAAINNYTNAPHESLTHSNESVVQRVTGPWSESTTTWNNQPAATAQDEVRLLQSTSGTQDYTNLDVTAMVQQMVSGSNNGFLIKMVDETPYARMIFASGDNPDSSRRPALEVCFSTNAAVPEFQKDVFINAFPNPATDFVTIETSSPLKKLEVCNLLGEIIFSEKPDAPDKQTILNMSGFCSGVYILHVTTAAGSGNKKIILGHS